MFKSWILVANAARGAIYLGDAKLAKLEPVHSLVHPESRLKNSEINTDAQGHTRVNTSFSAENDPHDHEVEIFAKEVADVLRRGRVDRSFDKLILVASPRFLGALRAHLDVDTARLVSDSINHDWTTQNANDVAGSIRDALAK